MSSAAGPVLIFWQETAKPLALDIELAAAVGPSVRSWEGKIISAAGTLLPPYTMYFAPGPRIPASWPMADNILSMTRKKLILKGPTAKYGVEPLFAADGRFLAANARWVEKDWGRHYWDNASGQTSARFAAAIANGNLDLAVEVVDLVHCQPSTGNTMWQGDGLQFAVDCTREGYADDRCEFQAALTKNGPELFKDKAPSLVGDLPTDWTPPGRAVKNGFLKVEKLPGNKMRYQVRMRLSELYPLVLRPGERLRFSLLVNDNNGSTRAGWLNWSNGIGDAKDPVHYGTLIP
jgi:hypothetical protein